MKKIKLVIFLFLFVSVQSEIMCSEVAPLTINYDNTHDIASLRSWGPYSKKYIGISHIPDINKGIRFDFSIMPGYYRNSQSIPYAMFESGYYPWEITPSMNKITYRYELEWKDKVYVDVTYFMLDDNQTLVKADIVNNTDLKQNIILNNIAYIDYPNDFPRYKAFNAENVRWYPAIDYSQNEPKIKQPQYNLVFDGLKRNEERSPYSLNGSLIGKGFGKEKGDRINYKITIPKSEEQGTIAFRYKIEKNEIARFQLKGIINDQIELKGNDDFTIFTVPYTSNKAGTYDLELISLSQQPIQLDGFFVGTSQNISKIEIKPFSIPFTPIIEKDKEQQSLILKYKDCDTYYGIAWNFKNSEIREVLNNELVTFLRQKNNDHVSKVFVGNKQWHYTDIFLRPIVVNSNSQNTLYFLLCNGEKSYVEHSLNEFRSQPDKTIAKSEEIQKDEQVQLLPNANEFLFGKKMLQASLLSNVVYPIYTQKQYIRHFAPGKIWDCLYTWDSGFISLGLIDLDINKAFECVKAYTTEVGNESAFIHRGTPLPIQFFAYFDIWNNSQSNQVLEYLYPRLKQYFDFMAGVSTYSTTRMKGTNLIRTWDYFYNSGGWDDYPPQYSLIDNQHLYKNVTPVVSSAYYIRAAKIMKNAAKQLGINKDIGYYDAIIEKISSSLQAYSWDEQTGYYSYVVHDSLGKVIDKYRYTDGSNYNKGLDGVTPLVAGISNQNQIDRMLDHIFTKGELWSDVGISSVDQTASYYKADGYWNGAVWFPHQWVLWKTMLDLGKGDLAFKIANTALKVWEQESKQTYHTFEHIIVSSGRGAGWHQFSGLSSPIINWFTSYYKIGKVSTGFEIWIKNNNFNNDYTNYTADINLEDTDISHERCMLVCMNPDKSYSAYFNGKLIKSRTYYPGLLEITIPQGKKHGVISVKPEN